MTKKILASLIAALILGINFSAIAATNKFEKVDATAQKITIPKEKKKKYNTVAKHYNPYLLKLKNNNEKAILLSANSELIFITNNDETITSASRRDIYRKSRKRDIGRYYSLGVPGTLIGAGITGITLFIGAPIGAAVMVGMYVPVDKAVRTNVEISQTLNAEKDFPSRIEPNKQYEIFLLVPKNIELKEAIITNASYDLKNQKDILIKIANENKL